MPTALVQGTQVMEWGGLTLHGQLASWRDRRVRRIAQHTYDRRDGAQSEDMGRAAHVTECTLLFDGANGLSTLRQFLKLWDENPTRLLVHPIYGRMNATWVGVESGTLTVDSGANLYTVSGQFVESNINADAVTDGSQSVSARAAAVDSQSLLVTAEVADASFSTAALVTTVATFTTAAGTFSTAAAATTASTDPSLPGMLTAALTAGSAAVTAIRAAADDGPAAAESVIACEILQANLIDLGAACLARQPTLIEYRVGETAHLLAIAGNIYKGDALDRMTEIRNLNPSVLGLIVPAGTVLTLAAA